MPWPGFDPPPDLVSRILRDALWNDERDRLLRFKEAWMAYTGNAEPALEVGEGGPDDNVVVPYEQLVVNKGRSYLFGKGDISFEIENEAAVQAGVETPDPNVVKGAMPGPQQWLDNTWRFNRKKTFLLKLATNGGVFGMSFVKIVPRQPYPRLVNLDPATVVVHWNDADIEDVEAYEIRWNTVDADGEPVVRREMIVKTDAPIPEPPSESESMPVEQTAVTRPSTGNTDEPAPARPPGAPEPPSLPPGSPAAPPMPSNVWEITLQESRADEPEWRTIGGPDLWPFGWPPVIDCQNLPLPNEYWGMSDIEKAVLSMNTAINRLLSNINRIVRLHAHPFLYTLGLSQSELAMVEINLNPDSILNLPNPDADLKSLEMQSDLASSISLYEKLKELYHEVTRIPEVATGKVENIGPMSGAALEILYGPLGEVTEDKRCMYGDMLTELNRRLLELGGWGVDMWVNTNWPDVMPHDPQAEGTMLLQDMQLGASKKTLLEKRGYDADREIEQQQEEATRNMELQMQRMERGLAIPAGPQKTDNNRRDDGSGGFGGG